MKNILLAILTAVLFIAMPFVLICLNRVYDFSHEEQGIILPFAIVIFFALGLSSAYFINQELKNK